MAEEIKSTASVLPPPTTKERIMSNTEIQEKPRFDELIKNAHGDIGNVNFCNGFSDGYLGRDQTSEHPDYLDGYGRGYETSEKQSALSTLGRG